MDTVVKISPDHVGKRVFSQKYGAGTITKVYSKNFHPRNVEVTFDNSETQSYHDTGEYEARNKYSRYDQRNIRFV